MMEINTMNQIKTLIKKKIEKELNILTSKFVWIHVIDEEK